jgi:trans-aconitate methyltransferase
VASWDAEAYRRVSLPQQAWGRRVLDRVALDGDERALDGGCGAGLVTALLAERLPHGRVIAVDRSQAMLAAARRELGRFGARVQLVRADLSSVALARPVDLIVSTATLHWILDHDRLFANLFALLAPGGRLVAQCGGGANVARLHRRALDWMAAHAPGAAFREPWFFADAGSTAHRLAAAGFVDVETSLEPAPTPFPDADTFREFITKVVLRDHLAALPDDPSRAALLDHLVALTARDDPPLTLDYVRLNLSARRS